MLVRFTQSISRLLAKFSDGRNTPSISIKTYINPEQEWVTTITKLKFQESLYNITFCKLGFNKKS
jgi:hypothetical protein